MQYPELVNQALSQRDGDWAWVWFQASTGERAEVDRWLVADEHPLAMQPGTPEQRFRTVVAELQFNDWQA